MILSLVWALGGVGLAQAAGKPSIAVLGLEVYDNGGGIDPETTKAAKDLTNALRDRVKGTAPYALLPGGEKELIDEKLLNNCDTEAAVCMAAIGSELGAEALLYGKIEKSAQNGQVGYKLSLKLLNVGRKQIVQTATVFLPIADVSGAKVLPHVRNWYATLTGTGTGTLVIRSNADHGTVLLDGETRETLSGGTLTLANIPEGRHTLAIESKDYQRYEAPITIHSGETVTQNAQLADLPRTLTPSRDPMSVEGTVGTRSRGNVFRPIFYASTVLEAAAIGFTVYEWRQAVSAAPGGSSDAECGGKSAHPDDKVYTSALNSACNHNTLNKYGFVAVGVAGVAMIGSFVLGFVRDDGHETAAASNGRRHKHRELAITPIVSPNGGGATLRFDW